MIEKLGIGNGELGIGNGELGIGHRELVVAGNNHQSPITIFNLLLT
ncbi:MAG: hypothetical protein WBA89_20550 [Microcoleus sp.]